MANTKVIAVFLVCIVFFAAQQVQNASAQGQEEDSGFKERFKACFGECRKNCTSNDHSATFCEMKCDANCGAKEAAAKLGITLRLSD